MGRLVMISGGIVAKSNSKLAKMMLIFSRKISKNRKIFNFFKIWCHHEIFLLSPYDMFCVIISDGDGLI